MNRNSRVSLFKSIVLILLLFNSNLYTQNSTVTKKGGLCFRVDDNHTMAQFNEYANLFNKYNKNFCFALNLGRKEFESSDYINGVKNLQSFGHELLDHTPEHRTSYFNTKFNTLSYLSLPGVDHINGTKICLKYSDEINTHYAKRTGYVDINGNNITSDSNEFGDFLSSERYIYFPDLPNNKLVIKKEIINDSLMEVSDAWGNSIDLGKHNHFKYYTFSVYYIHMTIDALNVLANETKKIADSLNITRPVSWIQPGVSSYIFPYVYREEIKQSFGINFNYVSAAVYPYTSEKTYKIFNEYDPKKNKQYGMQWGDFNIDTEPLPQNKTIIANSIAKHHVLIGHSHFNNLLGGWNAYLERVDSLLAWCTRNDIPVRTYKKWSDILYNQIPNPKENVFPVLYKDLDENGTPDGYKTLDGTWNSNDGIDSSKNYCYSIKAKGTFFKIKDLGGIEKGKNYFEIWTKGENGDSVEVTFKVKKQEFKYKFPSNTNEWTRYTLNQSANNNHILDISEKASMIDVEIRCSDYSSGNVKISGMQLYKKEGTENLTVSPKNIIISPDSGSTSFSISSNVSWNISNNANWLTVSPTNGNGNQLINVSYKVNMDSLSRTDTVSVFSNSIIKKVTIIQNGLPVYKVYTDQEPSGTCNIVGNGNYIEGTQATITCIPYEGWKFESWKENGTIVSTDSSYSFIVKNTHHFIAMLTDLTSVDSHNSVIPTKYKLFQNYPNPFNPNTTIKFAIPKYSLVKLEIYNLLGEKIETLADKDFPAGYYSVIFNAAKYPSGIYLYKLKTEGYQQSKKLILLK